MSDRTADLGFYYIGSQPWLVVSRSLIPSHRTKIIPKLCDVIAASTVIAAENHAAALVPLVYWLKISFLAELYDNIIVIKSCFYCRGRMIKEQISKHGKYIISLAALKLPLKIVAPKGAAHIKVQFIREKEIQPLAHRFAHKTRRYGQIQKNTINFNQLIVFRELVFLIVDMLIPEMEAYHKKIYSYRIEERKRHQRYRKIIFLHLRLSKTELLCEIRELLLKFFHLQLIAEIAVE